MEIWLAALGVLIIYFVSRKININISEWLEILAAAIILFLLLYS